MSQELGFFTVEHEKAYSELIDGMHKGKGIVEIVDGYAARFFIGWLDNDILQRHVIDRFAISDEVVEYVRTMSDHVLAKDYNAAAEVGAEVLNSFIDIPGIREDEEGMIFSGLLSMLVGLITRKSNEA